MLPLSVKASVPTDVLIAMALLSEIALAIVCVPLTAIGAAAEPLSSVSVEPLMLYAAALVKMNAPAVSGPLRTTFGWLVPALPNSTVVLAPLGMVAGLQL